MNLLEVKNLHTHFHTDRGLVPALNGVSFSIKKEKYLGLSVSRAAGKVLHHYQYCSYWETKEKLKREVFNLRARS